MHRSHSGHYGIVNSEEGFQNLTRFLFGQLRVDGILEIDAYSLPAEVQAQKDEGRDVKASYQFEVVVSVRGCQWQMTRRDARENSAIFRTWEELFPEAPDGSRQPDRRQSPHLLAFLDPSKSRCPSSGSVSLGFDVKALVPDYTIDGLLFTRRHYEGGHIYRSMILLKAFQDASALGGWRRHVTVSRTRTPASPARLPSPESFRTRRSPSTSRSSSGSALASRAGCASKPGPGPSGNYPNTRRGKRRVHRR